MWLILGGSGLLGREVKRYALGGYFAPNSQHLEISHAKQVYQLIERGGWDVIINCAAMTDVDACELDPEKAMAINGYGAENVAYAARKFRVPLIHISTDYVFNGSPNPIPEGTDTNPINAYGISKAYGEYWVRDFNKHAVIMRTSHLYGEHSLKGFVPHIVRQVVAGADVIKAPAHRSFQPTSARSAARAVVGVARELIAHKLMPPVLHAVSPGEATHLALARAIVAEMRHRGHGVEVTEDVDWRDACPRPARSALSVDAWEGLDVPCPPSWWDELPDVLPWIYHRVTQERTLNA